MSDSDSPTSDAYAQSPLPILWVVAAVIRHGDRVFAGKRKAGGGSGLKWELPGGKVEPDESAVQALKREIFEELALNVEVGRCLGTFTTPSGKYLIRLECYWCTAEREDVTLHSHVAAGWFDVAGLIDLDWAAPDVPAVKLIIDALRRDQ